MSDILIRGMEMPTEYSLWIAVSADGTVQYNYFSEWKTAEEKAVPVPPHGRLIDADALIEAMARMVPWAITDPTENAFLDGLSAAYEATNAAPTIIAEEGEA